MTLKKEELIYADECYQIMGLIFEVYNDLGYGHKELYYQKAIASKFDKNNISYTEQLRVRFRYQGEILGVHILDFLVNDKIVIELKQRDYFSKQDIKQIYSYLKATNLKLGLLVHFTKTGVRYKRIVNVF